MATERLFSTEELEDIPELLSQAYELLNLNEASLPETAVEIVEMIEAAVDDLRDEELSEEEATNLAFPLGYLLGEQVRKTVGWEWRYVTQDNGFESYGVVRPDKAFVYFAMKDIYDLLLNSEDELNLVLLFNMITGDALEVPGAKRLYLSLG